MAQSKKRLENLLPIEEVNSRRTREQHRKDSQKAGKASGASRRRHKSLQETMLMVSKLPLDDIGLNRAKRSGVDLDGVDEYDLTALTAVVIGQVRAAANGNSQAAQVVADWMDMSEKHRKAQLEIERLQAEIEKTRAEIDKLRAGQDLEDDDQVLQFIEGMKRNDPPDAEAD